MSLPYDKQWLPLASLPFFVAWCTFSQSCCLPSFCMSLSILYRFVHYPYARLSSLPNPLHLLFSLSPSSSRTMRLRGSFNKSTVSCAWIKRLSSAVFASRPSSPGFPSNHTSCFNYNAEKNLSLLVTVYALLPPYLCTIEERTWALRMMYDVTPSRGWRAPFLLCTRTSHSTTPYIHCFARRMPWLHLWAACHRATELSLSAFWPLQ